VFLLPGLPTGPSCSPAAARRGWSGRALLTAAAERSPPGLRCQQSRHSVAGGVCNLPAPSRERKAAPRYASWVFRKIPLLCPSHMQRRNEKPDLLNSDKEETDSVLMQKRCK